MGTTDRVITRVSSDTYSHLYNLTLLPITLLFGRHEHYSRVPLYDSPGDRPPSSSWTDSLHTCTGRPSTRKDLPKLTGNPVVSVAVLFVGDGSVGDESKLSFGSAGRQEITYSHG